MQLMLTRTPKVIVILMEISINCGNAAKMTLCNTCVRPCVFFVDHHNQASKPNTIFFQ